MHIYVLILKADPRGEWQDRRSCLPLGEGRLNFSLSLCIESERGPSNLPLANLSILPLFPIPSKGKGDDSNATVVCNCHKKPVTSLTLTHLARFEYTALPHFIPLFVANSIPAPHLDHYANAKPPHSTPAQMQFRICTGLFLYPPVLASINIKHSSQPVPLLPHHAKFRRTRPTFAVQNRTPARL